MLFKSNTNYTNNFRELEIKNYLICKTINKSVHDLPKQPTYSHDLFSPKSK